jgi:hypothetical protein
VTAAVDAVRGALLVLAAELEDRLATCLPETTGVAAYSDAARIARRAAERHIEATPALEPAPGVPESAQAVTEADSTPRGAVPVRLGEFARVDIMGHDARTGWVTDGSLAGAACLDVRDETGRLIAKIPPHSVYMYQPVAPPRAALPPGPGMDSPELPATLPDLDEITGAGDPWASADEGPF